MNGPVFLPSENKYRGSEKVFESKGWSGKIKTG